MVAVYFGEVRVDDALAEVVDGGYDEVLLALMVRAVGPQAGFEV